MSSTGILGISSDLTLALALGAIGTVTVLFLLYAGGDKKFDEYRRRGKEVDALRDDSWIETPLIKSGWLSDHIGNGCVVSLKLDCLQPSGSFKVRGISSFMKNRYRLNNRIDTFITTSSANAGMAVAYVANELNCKCLIILDEGQRGNELLTEFTKVYGAEIQFHGATWNEADEYAVKLGEHDSGKYCYVPMFDDGLIFSGHSSITDELKQHYAYGEGGATADNPDCIVVAVGGGGLLMGVLSGLFSTAWARKCKVVAAQSEHCALFESAVNNSYTPIPKKCVTCDGVELGHRAICNQALNFAQRFNQFNPVKSMIVKDLDVLNICTLTGIKQKVLIEPLCGVALTAVYKNKPYFKQFKNICIIVCGGNHIYFNPKLLENSIQENLFNDQPDVMPQGQSNKSKPIKQVIKSLAADYGDDDEEEEEKKEPEDEVYGLSGYDDDYDDDDDVYDSDNEEI